MRLREFRERLGITQAELSRLSGVSRCKISQYECGHMYPRQLSTLVKLAKVLGCTINDLADPADLAESEDLAEQQEQTA